MNWGNGNTSEWPTFSDLHCHLVSEAGVITQHLSEDRNQATAACSFRETDTPIVGNPDTFWDISLVRSGDGRWLINNYGTG